MGYEKFKRPLFAREGMQVGHGTSTAGSTFNSPVVFPTETITAGTAAKTLSKYGVSFVTYASSGKPNDIIIPDPPKTGTDKYIFVQNNTTSVELNLNTASTTHLFWGTTFNTINISAASTGSPGGTPAGSAALHLIAASTTQWAVYPGSTFNWDFAASTGSTATA